MNEPDDIDDFETEEEEAEEADEDQDLDGEEMDLGGVEKGVTHYIRCATHSFALAIKDSLVKCNRNNSITKVRVIVKRLRNPNILAALAKKDCNAPKLDVVTRWSSTFEMLERFLSLEDVINEYGQVDQELNVPNQLWDQIESLTDVLGGQHSY